MAIVLGLNAKLYYLSTGTRATWNSPGPAPANLSELSDVKDVTLNLETGEADVTTRGGDGWRQTAATLKDGSIEFEMVWDPGDAGFTAILTAFLSNSDFAMVALDGAKDAVGSQGLWADFQITNFTRAEPLEEALMISVTAKPARSSVSPEWVVVAT